MTRQRRSRLLRRVVAPAIAALVLTVGVRTGVGLANASGTSTSSTSSTLSTSKISIATAALSEKPQAGWSVASASARGVMVDFRNVTVGGVVFRALRLRARTTLLRWHVGSGDPNLFAKAPADAGPAIFWPSEGLAGVVAVFNGGFKQSALAGGSMVDGVTLVPLMRGHMTVAIDAAGHWAMGVWGGANFPPKGFHAISYRQNLGPLVMHGALTPAGASPNWSQWGSPLGRVPREARTGLGVDAKGNLIYVATMTGVLPPQLGQALIAAGVVTAMELDINPYWPILGGSRTPIHASGGAYPVQLPASEHSPVVFETGWSRDFFVALAEPPTWSCSWSSPGLKALTGRVQPQRLHKVGRGCDPVSTTTPTTSSTPTTTTTARASVTTSTPGA